MCASSPRQTETFRHEVAEGRFRMDLYYRLNVFPVHVPPLRERPDDIPILVDYFAATVRRPHGKADSPNREAYPRRDAAVFVAGEHPGTSKCHRTRRDTCRGRGISFGAGYIAGNSCKRFLHGLSKHRFLVISRRQKSKPCCAKHADVSRVPMVRPPVWGSRRPPWSPGSGS